MDQNFEPKGDFPANEPSCRYQQPFQELKRHVLQFLAEVGSDDVSTSA